MLQSCVRSPLHFLYRSKDKLSEENHFKKFELQTLKISECKFPQDLLKDQY